jgi:hypothetical protein
MQRSLLLSLLLVTGFLWSGCDSQAPDATQRVAVAEGDQASGRAYHLVWDQFKDGFSVDGPDAKWFYFAAGPHVGNDGTVTTSRRSGLRVVSSGTNQATGEPAFTLSLGQEGSPDNPFGLPGTVDHVKWLAFMNAATPSGVPGFEAVEGQELSCEATMSGETFGTAGHPFGSAVANAEDDFRLATVTMSAIDFETFVHFLFAITNERIYAIYERPPLARAVFGDYAGFVFGVPVAERNPGDEHKLEIAFDKAAGTVRWLVQNREVFRVDAIGHLIDREHLLIDHGGTEQLVSPNQLDCGMGLLNLLDGRGPGGEGLVRISNTSDFYFDPEVGAPAPASFVDEASAGTSRLFGQGAELRMKRFAVSSRPSND